MISGEVMLSPTIYQSHVGASKRWAHRWVGTPGPVPVTDTAVALAAKACITPPCCSSTFCCRELSCSIATSAIFPRART
jgi:hypothetical protein